MCLPVKFQVNVDSGRNCNRERRLLSINMWTLFATFHVNLTFVGEAARWEYGETAKC